MEMDYAVCMSLNNICREKKTCRHILGDFACHVVALDGVDRGVLVGVLLLHILVVALDERENLLIRSICLTEKRLLIAICNILLGNLMGTHLHDLRLDDILNLLNRHRAITPSANARNFLCNQVDASFRERIFDVHNLACLADSISDLGNIKRFFLATALDNIHFFHF